jgi:NAD(P)-dependent dehydrogenase (short-subunit alcohol dehydrogenase family)
MSESPTPRQVPDAAGQSIAGMRFVVTGASSGLGAATTRHLVAQGAQVLAVARRAERLQALATELEDAAGSLWVRRADVTIDDDVDAAIAAAVEAMGGIDVLVNNAGSEIQGSIDQLTPGAFEAMFRANVMSAYLCTRAALSELRRSRGLVVNLGSTVVTRPPRGRFGYVASKGAVEAMTRALALDLGADGIRVNVVRPGIIPSELRGLSEADERRRFEAGAVFPKQVLPVVGEGLDIARAIEWLAGPGGRFVTGAVIDIDAGYSLGALPPA